MEAKEPEIQACGEQTKRPSGRDVGRAWTERKDSAFLPGGAAEEDQNREDLQAAGDHQHGEDGFGEGGEGGKVFSRPGPTLLMQVRAALKETAKDSPSRETTRVPPRTSSR